jgi:molybdate transport system substrate-binding protein
VRRVLAVAAGLLALVTSACGDESKPRLVVSAASSLTEALTKCSPDFPDAAVRLQFGGSDALAEQIRRGVKPDVFAAADAKLAAELNGEGLLGGIQGFATNRLVLAVPADSKRVRSMGDLRKSGTKLAIGSKSVPIGSYTREVLSHLPDEERSQILKNVRSEEPDVKGVVGKLTQGAVDAGFVYASDVTATQGKLEAIQLPARLRLKVAYGAGVVTGSNRKAAARRYVEGLVSGTCARDLRKAGFGQAPE